VWWLDARRRYFYRQASREGFEFDEEILTVFERLRSGGQSISRIRLREVLSLFVLEFV